LALRGVAGALRDGDAPRAGLVAAELVDLGAQLGVLVEPLS